MKIPEKIISICNLLNTQNATDIVVCDTTKRQNTVDYFVIATLKSATQIKSAVDFIFQESAKMPLIFGEPKREDFILSDWVVIDFDNAFVHLFTKEQRNRYNLDKFIYEGGNIISYKRLLATITAQKKKEQARLKMEQSKLAKREKESAKTSKSKKIKKEKAK